MSLADSSSAGPSALTVGPVLYDQLNGQTTTNPADISSQDFETSLDAADSEAADDFVVPAGLTWSIDGIDVDGEYFSRDGLDPCRPASTCASGRTTPQRTCRRRSP